MRTIYPRPFRDPKTTSCPPSPAHHFHQFKLQTALRGWIPLHKYYEIQGEHVKTRHTFDYQKGRATAEVASISQVLHASQLSREDGLSCP